MQQRARVTKGFSIIEMIVVVAVISIISAIIIISFYDANKPQVLEKDSAVVAAVFERARSLTLSSSERRRYGVHVESGSVTLFSGDAYDANGSGNRVENLNSKVTIAEHAFAGGGDEVIFKRLTGETDHPGYLKVSLTDDPSVFYTITILGTGLVEIE